MTSRGSPSDDVQEDLVGNHGLAGRDSLVGVLIDLVVAEDAKLVADELTCEERVSVLS